MRTIRLIARLDTKNQNLIKGINFEGLKILGNPKDFAGKYYLEGIDEIAIFDTIASLYGMPPNFDLINVTTKNLFIPIGFGGGIKTVDDARMAFRNGSDKIYINSGTFQNSKIVSEIAQIYGNQSVCISLQVKRDANKNWTLFYDNGRENANKDPLEWAFNSVNNGAGEVLVTSVDMDGTKRGYDIELIRNIVDNINVPVIASGGCGSSDHVLELVEKTGVTAVSIGTALHYNLIEIEKIKDRLINNGFSVAA